MARLPGNSPLDHVQHRESDKPLEGPVYDRVILKFHLIRGTITPGIEFFDDGEAKARVDLAKSIFYIDLPKLTVASPQQILSFRHEAHRAGIADFWREIEEQSKWATGAGQSPVARGEKIRQDWEKWNRDRAWSRGAGVAAGALTTFVVWAWGPHGLESAAEALAAGAALGFIPPWFTEWHARWIEYNSHRREAFKCISRVDKAIRKVK